MLINHDAISDYIFALRKMRDIHEVQNHDAEAKKYDQYAEALFTGQSHVRYGAPLGREEAGKVLMQIMFASRPDEIGIHLPFHRQSAAYDATNKLARAIQRVKDGKPAKKRFGLFG